MSAETIFPAHFGVKLTKWHHSLTDATRPVNNKRTQGKPFVVLVAGAGKGIGYHIALSYVRAGATGLVIVSRTQADLDKLSEKALQMNPDLVILSKTLDVKAAPQVEELSKECVKKFGGCLDVVVANAGAISKAVASKDGVLRSPFGIDDNEFQHVMDTNITGTWLFARFFVPLLRDNPNTASPKAFITITSTGAHATFTDMVPASYLFSKMVVVRMAEWLHTDYHSKWGVQAFAVQPGHVRTSFTEEVATKVDVANVWQALLEDDVELCGGFMTWLTKERREWLSGRLVNANFDVEELENMQSAIVEEDKLKFRMIV